MMIKKGILKAKSIFYDMNLEIYDKLIELLQTEYFELYEELNEINSYKIKYKKILYNYKESFLFNKYKSEIRYKILLPTIKKWIDINKFEYKYNYMVLYTNNNLDQICNNDSYYNIYYSVSNDNLFPRGEIDLFINNIFLYEYPFKNIIFYTIDKNGRAYLFSNYFNNNNKRYIKSEKESEAIIEYSYYMEITPYYPIFKYENNKYKIINNNNCIK